MKKMIIAGVMALSTCVISTAFASEEEEYSAAVGVQAIARAVVEKKLVDIGARKTIAMALETGKAGLGKMECDRGLGSDYCFFDVFIKDDETTKEAEETLYRLDVRLREGKVVSATWNLIAG